jgi:hypothetical protein
MILELKKVPRGFRAYCKCDECEIEYQRPNGRLKKDSLHTFCSNRCAGLWYVKNRPEKSNILYNKFGSENKSWKGGRIVRGEYIMLYKPNHPNTTKDKYVFEHRLVMEKKLGRYLTKEETVHHINGIKTDNRIENLMLFNNDLEHKMYHIEQKIRNYFLTLLMVKKMRSDLKWAQ